MHKHKILKKKTKTLKFCAQAQDLKNKTKKNNIFFLEKKQNKLVSYLIKLTVATKSRAVTLINDPIQTTYNMHKLARVSSLMDNSIRVHPAVTQKKHRNSFRYLSIHTPIYLSTYLSIHPHSHPSIQTSTKLLTNPFIQPVIHISTHISIHPHTCLFIHTSIHSFIHIHLVIHSFTSMQIFIQSSIYSFTSIHISIHSSTHPLTHPSIHSQILTHIHLVIHASIHASQQTENTRPVSQTHKQTLETRKTEETPAA